ncbi:hypothetical protein CGRA01v4_11757 [Colletotrichum graminicola]|nr:hypothetical protein CGRA01v4_11757 [Colletotrichum graminicola]
MCRRNGTFQPLTQMVPHQLCPFRCNPFRHCRS